MNELEQGENLFANHVVNDHHLWNYLFFVVRLLHTDQEQGALGLSRLELVMKLAVQKLQIHFMPIGRALYLEDPEVLDGLREDAIEFLNTAEDDEMAIGLM